MLIIVIDVILIYHLLPSPTCIYHFFPPLYLLALHRSVSLCLFVSFLFPFHSLSLEVLHVHTMRNSLGRLSKSHNQLLEMEY